MADDPDNLVLGCLRWLDEKVDRVGGDVRELKGRMPALEEIVVGVQRRMDGLDLLLDGVGKRLDIADMHR